MRYGNKLVFLAFLLVGLVATMIVLKYLIEGFASCTISPTSNTAIVTINNSSKCYSPGDTIANASNTPIANAGDSISIQFGGAFNAPFSIQYDTGIFTIPNIHPDGSWPRKDNVQFTVPTGRKIISMSIGNNIPISEKIMTWLSGLVSTSASGSGSRSGSGYSSGSAPLYNPLSLDQGGSAIYDPTVYGGGGGGGAGDWLGDYGNGDWQEGNGNNDWQGDYGTGDWQERNGGNGNRGSNQDCSTYDDCSC